jgi:hypothetical protein
MQRSCCLLPFCALLAACATGGSRAHVIQVTTLKPKCTAPIDRNGVGVIAGVVTWDSAPRYRDSQVIVHWLEPDDRMPTSHQRIGATGPSVERWGQVPVVPMPTFVFGLENQTDHPVTLQPSQFRLIDAAGSEYPQLTGLNDVMARVEQLWVAQYPGLLNAPAIRDDLRQKMDTLPFLTGPVEVAPGKSWVGYVAFEVDAFDPAELSRLVERVGALELLYQDSCGTVPFAFERATVALQVQCPDDSRPTLERCRPGASPRPSAYGR